MVRRRSETPVSVVLKISGFGDRVVLKKRPAHAGLED
jgi:hypothetical protein